MPQVHFTGYRDGSSSFGVTAAIFKITQRPFVNSETKVQIIFSKNSVTLSLSLLAVSSVFRYQPPAENTFHTSWENLH